MAHVHVTILSGLGHVASNGIIYDLAARLVRTDNVSVAVSSYSDYVRRADEARRQTTVTHLVQVGHSLGAAVAPQWARLVGRTVAGIFGFDPAENPFADASQYRLTKVPPNVKVARSVFVPGGALGGGGYEAEDESKTKCENWPIDTAHTKIDEAIEEHLTIDEFVKRLVEA